VSLAARCPACRTAFRVVPDQLRISGGWVRCGRCADVFDANETLFDLRSPAASVARSDTAPGSDTAAPQAAEAAPPESARGDAADESVAEHAPAEPADEPPVDTPLEPHAAPAADWTPEPTIAPAAPMPSGEPALVAAPAPPEPPAPWPSVDAAADDVGAVGVDAETALAPADHAATPEIAPVDDTPRDTVGAQAASTDDRIEPSLAATAPEPPAPSADATTAAAAPEAETPATPAFVREAERAERWQSPEMRALLGGAAVLLAGAALIQGLRGFHAPLTAEWPQTRTWVEPLCRLAGCQLEPRRRLDAMSVEGSSLVQLDGSALTQLSLVLRNRDRAEVLLPAIELTLTDVQGTVVARKVFAAGELGAANAAIAGDAELALQGVLDTSGLPVVGYTIELFYP
jgi:predicted Zn finger-like uncharacterized protein